MAVNPAEDIVNVWLQENRGYFTWQNVNVPKKMRIVKGKRVYGGKGKEIDILGINNKGGRVWVEVTVSPNPYLSRSSNQVGHVVKIIKDKFHEEKEDRVREIFGKKRFRKLFVYSERLFSGSKDEKSQSVMK